MSVSVAERIIFAIYFGFVGTFGLIANIGILVVLLKSKDYRRRPSTYYLYSILISSILASLYVLPYNTFSVVAKLPKPTGHAYETECRISLFFVYSITTVKIFVLVGMSLDRFIAVLYPYFYVAYMTKLKARMINVFLWIASIAIMLPILAKDSLSRYKGEIGLSCGVDWKVINKAYFICVMLFGFVLPFVVMIVTNIKVFIVARKQQSLINKRYVRHQMGGTETFPENGGSKLTTVFTRELETTMNQNNELPCQNQHPRISCVPSNLNGPSRSSETSTCNSKRAPGALGSPKEKLSNGLSPKILDTNDFDTVEHANMESGFRLNNLAVNENDFTLSKKLAAPIENSNGQSLINKIVDNVTNSSDQSKVTKSKKYKGDIEWSIVCSTLFIAAAFFITWTPYAISRGIESFTSILGARVALYTNAPTYLDVVLNPLIFIGARYTLRTKFFNCLFCKD